MIVRIFPGNPNKQQAVASVRRKTWFQSSVIVWLLIWTKKNNSSESESKEKKMDSKPIMNFRKKREMKNNYMLRESFVEWKNIAHKTIYILLFSNSLILSLPVLMIQRRRKYDFLSQRRSLFVSLDNYYVTYNVSHTLHRDYS